jgi:NAD(P)H dehydrogenase (quinone)
MSKIVITAATGELGQLVVQHLLKRVSADQIAVSGLKCCEGIKIC